MANPTTFGPLSVSINSLIAHVKMYVWMCLFANNTFLVQLVSTKEPELKGKLLLVFMLDCAKLAVIQVP
jgi:hypothetical protein